MPLWWDHDRAEPGCAYHRREHFLASDRGDLREDQPLRQVDGAAKLGKQGLQQWRVPHVFSRSEFILCLVLLYMMTIQISCGTECGFWQRSRPLTLGTVKPWCRSLAIQLVNITERARFVFASVFVHIYTLLFLDQVQTWLCVEGSSVGGCFRPEDCHWFCLEHLDQQQRFFIYRVCKQFLFAQV